VDKAGKSGLIHGLCATSLQGSAESGESRLIPMVTAGVTLKPKNKQEPAASREKRRGAGIGLLQKMGPGLIYGRVG